MNPWTELVTFGLALLGAVLGVINTWRAVNRDQVKLRVRLVDAVAVKTTQFPPKMVGFEVTNLSGFPVTIAKAGLKIQGSKKDLVLADPFLLDDQKWPRRLESREQVTAYIPAGLLRDDEVYTAVFVTTVCGETRKSKFRKNEDRPIRTIMERRPRQDA